MSITHFTIFGERCTGTNYLEKLMTLNFNVEVTWKYQWKHFPLKDTDYSRSNNTLFICIVRNVTDWLNSFYNNMHHLPLNYKNISKQEKMDEFLNGEFWSCDDRTGEPMMVNDEIQDLIIKGKLLDRHIYTGERYKNIFEMRSTKLQYLLEDLPKRVKHYLFIKYEDLMNDFENTMNKIKGRGLQLKDPSRYPINTDKYKGVIDMKYTDRKIEKVFTKKMIYENENFIKYDKYEDLLYTYMIYDSGIMILNREAILDICKTMSYNKRMLVFGLGEISSLLYEGNYENTYFIEDSDENIEKMKDIIPAGNIIKYEYGTSCKTAGLLKSKDIKKFVVPEKILEIAPFDIIVIDGPENYYSDRASKKYSKKPGRLIPYYWSSLLVKPGTVIYANESEYPLDGYFIERFFSSNKKEEFIGGDKCTKIYI